jgi:hypothetical protein
MTKHDANSLPVRNSTRATRFSDHARGTSRSHNQENSLRNSAALPETKSIPSSKLPIRSSAIYQSSETYGDSRISEKVHEACQVAQSQLEQRIIALELMNDRLRAEVEEHRRVNIELLKSSQGLRYAQMSRS